MCSYSARWGNEIFTLILRGDMCDFFICNLESNIVSEIDSCDIVGV